MVSAIHPHYRGGPAIDVLTSRSRGAGEATAVSLGAATLCLTMGRTKQRLTARRWDIVTRTPVREVFATMEQMVGTPPLRFEPLTRSSAHAVESERRAMLGYWTSKVKNPHWVKCTAIDSDEGTVVRIEATSDAGVISRALEFYTVLRRGGEDARTIYRHRTIQPGPVSLVASWAGMPYRLFEHPSLIANRGVAIHTATRVTAVSEQVGPFVEVETAEGARGWVEADQIVQSPSEATRAAGLNTALTPLDQ